jgi:hypothetical protein
MSSGAASPPQSGMPGIGPYALAFQAHVCIDAIAWWPAAGSRAASALLLGAWRWQTRRNAATFGAAT